MGGKVSVSLLVPRVLGDEVEVVSSDDDGSGHLAGRDDLSGEDSASDGDVTSERALLVWRAPGRRRARGRGDGGGERAAEEVTKRSEPIEEKEDRGKGCQRLIDGVREGKEGKTYRCRYR